MDMRWISWLAGQRPTKATIHRGSERKVPHIGTETRTKLLREAAVRNIGQWAEGRNKVLVSTDASTQRIRIG